MAFEQRPQAEQETLIFPDIEQAQEWRDAVGEQLRQQTGDVQQPREIIAGAVASELAAHGEGGPSLVHPWKHSLDEHSEVQGLVDMAFDQDISAALKKARSSEYYPRNIDLLHDTLTTELYEGLVEHKVNRQPMAGWLILFIGILAIVILVILLLWLV